MTSSGSEPAHDLVVYGATSFVGELIVDHLLHRHGVDRDLRWAIAGRDQAKLERISADRGVELPIIVADAADRPALDQLCASTRVVLSTVGPYARYGSELIAAVAASGTDYCDLTGEPQWVQAMIDAHQATAEASGARIVPSSGFDSIPSDLGVLHLQTEADKAFGRYCNQVAMRVKAAKGGASGGTIASAMNMIEELSADPSLRHVLTNPYALAPAGQRAGVRQPNVTLPTHDDASGQWVAPFVMAAVNTKVVHRTNALLGYRWSRDFRYDEAMMMGGGVAGVAKAGAVAGGLGAFMGAAAIGPVRRLLNDRVLPKPGTGPDAEARESGFFDLRFFGSTTDGHHLQTKVTGDRDPGYGSTAKMIGETAVAFLDLDHTVTPGGFHTTASAFGTSLIDRLQAHAGLTFSLVD